MTIINIKRARIHSHQETIEQYDKLRTLAYNMYTAAQYLTTDASKLKKACDDFYHYINFEEKEMKLVTTKFLTDNGFAVTSDIQNGVDCRAIKDGFTVELWRGGWMKLLYEDTFMYYCPTQELSKFYETIYLLDIKI